MNNNKSWTQQVNEHARDINLEKSKKATTQSAKDAYLKMAKENQRQVDYQKSINHKK